MNPNSNSTPLSSQGSAGKPKAKRSPKPLDATDFSEDDQRRFWKKVNKQGPNDCWEWLAYKNKEGYGIFQFLNKNLKSHRVSFVLSVSEIPDGMIICHTCDNPRCVNPAHLFCGTFKDNIVDCYSKNRMTNRTTWQRR
jgi:hypothetical protein